MRLGRLPKLEESVRGDVGQHEILIVADENLTEAEVVGPIGYGFHLAVGNIPRRHPVDLGGKGYDGVSRYSVFGHIGAHPAVEIPVL